MEIRYLLFLQIAWFRVYFNQNVENLFVTKSSKSCSNMKRYWIPSNQISTKNIFRPNGILWQKSQNLVAKLKSFVLHFQYKWQKLVHSYSLQKEMQFWYAMTIILRLRLLDNENDKENIFLGFEVRGRGRCSVWPEKNCQMSIKVAQKWFH